jgi:hypothetical protein
MRFTLGIQKTAQIFNVSFSLIPELREPHHFDPAPDNFKK